MARMAARNPKSNARDMIISMAVILIPVILLVYFFSSPGDADDPMAGDSASPKVNVAQTLEWATSEASFPLLYPAGLGEDWTPMRVGWAKDGNKWITGEAADGDSWQVGYLGPDEIYYGVQQRGGSGSGSAFITTTTREGSAVGGEADLAGHTWARYESKDGRTRSLVSKEDDWVAIVSADTDFMSLEAFAATLVEAAPAG